MSDSKHVLEFTKATGFDVPKKPTLMNKKEVLFIIKMILDETMELGATVAGADEIKNNMCKMILNSKDINEPYETMKSNELIGMQADAFVDIYYYSQNASCKNGVNLSSIFNIVHKANMDKRDTKTGKFLRRDDGKIIKPEGWVSPDITVEINRQEDEGAFTE